MPVFQRIFMVGFLLFRLKIATCLNVFFGSRLKILIWMVKLGFWPHRLEHTTNLGFGHGDWSVQSWVLFPLYLEGFFWKYGNWNRLRKVIRFCLRKSDDFLKWVLTSSKGLGMLRLTGSLRSWNDRIFIPNVIANAIVANIKRTQRMAAKMASFLNSLKIWN